MICCLIRTMATHNDNNTRDTHDIKYEVPIKVVEVDKTTDAITIQWECNNDPNYEYEIKYKCKDERYAYINTCSTTNEIQLENLKPGTEYHILFYMKRKDNDDGDLQQTLDICTKQTYIDQIVEESTDVQQFNQKENNENVKIFRPKFYIDEHVRNAKSLSFIERQTKKNIQDERVILLLGPTGAGKTTFIDGMFNFLAGVTSHDTNRFQITEDRKTSEIQSQTKDITCYRVPQVAKLPEARCSLVLIDTPGINDTENNQRMTDKRIVRQMYKLCTNSIDEVHAIYIVIPNANFRLDASMINVLDSIAKLFKTEMVPPVYAIITFYDDGDKHVLQALTKRGVRIDNDFTFSNGILFQEEKNVDKWKQFKNSYKTFLDEIMKVDAKSMHLSETILKNRVRVRSLIDDIQINLKILIQKLINFEIEKELRKRTDHDQNTYTVVDAVIQKAKTSKIKTALNCKVCERTCHFPCWSKWKMIRRSCDMIDDKSCIICLKGVCKMSDHVNESCRYTVHLKDDLREIKDLKSEDEIKKCIEQCENHLDEIVLKLKEKSDNLDTNYDKSTFIEDVMKQLIKIENEEKTCGFEKRIKVYERLQQNMLKLTIHET